MPTSNADAKTLVSRASQGDLTALRGILTALLDEGLTLARVTSTATELNYNDRSERIQTITAAGAIDLNERFVNVTGPAASTYAITLAAPTAAQEGNILTIHMTGTTATNAVTLALTNVVGGTAATTASFDAAGERLVLLASGDKWVVIKQQGVTLS